MRMRTHWPRLLCAAFGFALCFPLSAHALSPKAERGRAAMKKAECNRCHAISDLSGKKRGLGPAKRAKHCVNCHTWILGTKGNAKAIRKYRRDFPDWDRYLRNIEHFTALPDLGTLTRRVRPPFIRRYLDDPNDLRPHLDESMSQVKLSSRAKDDVVAYLSELNSDVLAVDEAAGRKPTSAQITQGRQLFESKGCVACHLVGSLKFASTYSESFYKKMKSTALLAPNLRFVRERIPRSVLVRHILDPAKVDPKTRMPNMNTKVAEVERIADFLLHADIGPKVTSQQRAPAVPLLKRTVLYDEVVDKVLGKICVHCHMDPAKNDGEGGPGNTGGLGWAGARLNLETYAGVKKGLIRNGKLISILEPERAGEPPLMLKALLRRHREAGRARGSGSTTGAQRPGMPLGLPPLSVEHLSLLKTWITQGAPGPR